MVRTFFVLFVLSFLILGCQMTPTRYDEAAEGQWNGRVLIKDKKKNQSQIVSVDINAIKDQKMRVDVTAALGTPVASLTLDGTKTQYVLFRQKAFYQGETQPKVLSPILAIEMDPRLLFSVLFENPPQDKSWTCKRDEKDFLKTCENSNKSLRIEWIERKGRRKTVKIDHANASLQLNLEGFQPKVVENPDLFSLKTPPGFKTYTIR